MQHFLIKQFNGLDDATVQRLHSLGLQVGSDVMAVRFYPFHGPVIIQVDHQKIGIRYRVFKKLTGGESS
ncbi:FeoA family protein [Secundilactobacillus yichangensis]|uniref:FeoA family protein n=1 Tax=Secundilactobacillus yichangensis TaxID=2799580 RepID=UPI0019457B84|nr:FeoA family protein [Secundilactobacillus yichangensis]